MFFLLLFSSCLFSSSSPICHVFINHIRIQQAFLLSFIQNKSNLPELLDVFNSHKGHICQVPVAFSLTEVKSWYNFINYSLIRKEFRTRNNGAATTFCEDRKYIWQFVLWLMAHCYIHARSSYILVDYCYIRHLTPTRLFGSSMWYAHSVNW